MPTDAEFKELVERVDEIGSRVKGTGDVAAQHGDRHADRGEDPIEGELVAGHTHAGGDTPVVEATTSSSRSSDGTSHTVSLPSGFVAGDLLVVGFGTDDASTLTWPASWSVLVTETRGTATGEVAMFEPTGSEGSTIIVTTNVSTKSAHVAYRISGARVGTTAVAAEASGTNATSANPDPPDLTPTGGARNFLWLAFAANAGGADPVITAGPSGYGTLLAKDEGLAAVGMADRGLFASSEDPAPFTSVNTTWVAGTIAIYPEEAGLHSGTPDAHHASFVGLLDNAASTVDPDTNNRVQITDDGVVNADKSGTTIALSILMARIFLGLATEDLIFINAGSTSATEQDWIEVTVGGNTGYIRVFAAK